MSGQPNAPTRTIVAASRRFAVRSPFHFFFSVGYAIVWLAVTWAALFVVQTWFIDNTFHYMFREPEYYDLFGYRHRETSWLVSCAILSAAWIGAMRIEARGPTAP